MVSLFLSIVVLSYSQLSPGAITRLLEEFMYSFTLAEQVPDRHMVMMIILIGMITRMMMIIIITTIIIAMATRAVSFPHVFLSDKSYYLVRSTGSMMLMANNDKTFPVVYFVHFQDWFTNFGFLHPELFHVLSCRQDLPILFFKNF